jgi:hypothetical protein
MARGRHWTEAELRACLAQGDATILEDGGRRLPPRRPRTRPQTSLPEHALALTTVEAPGRHCLTIPGLKLVSEKQQRDHWSVKAKRTRFQRATTYYALCETGWQPPCLPCTITLTRIAPAVLDTDNNVHSLSAVQDGVADWLGGGFGRGQDRQPGLMFAYAQDRGRPQEYAVQITLEETV